MNTRDSSSSLSSKRLLLLFLQREIPPPVSRVAGDSLVPPAKFLPCRCSSLFLPVPTTCVRLAPAPACAAVGATGFGFEVKGLRLRVGGATAVGSWVLQFYSCASSIALARRKLAQALCSHNSSAPLRSPPPPLALCPTTRTQCHHQQQQQHHQYHHPHNLACRCCAPPARPSPSRCRHLPTTLRRHLRPRPHLPHPGLRGPRRTCTSGQARRARTGQGVGVGARGEARGIKVPGIKSHLQKSPTSSSCDPPRPSSPHHTVAKLASLAERPLHACMHG